MSLPTIYLACLAKKMDDANRKWVKELHEIM